MSLLRVTVVPSSYQVREKHLFYGSRYALGIGAASFWSAAEKDRAESPTAQPERPKTIHNSQCIMHNFQFSIFKSINLCQIVPSLIKTSFVTHSRHIRDKFVKDTRRFSRYAEHPKSLA